MKALFFKYIAVISLIYFAPNTSAQEPNPRHADSETGDFQDIVESSLQGIATLTPDSVTITRVQNQIPIDIFANDVKSSSEEAKNWELDSHTLTVTQNTKSSQGSCFVASKVEKVMKDGREETVHSQQLVFTPEDPARMTVMSKSDLAKAKQENEGFREDSVVVLPDDETAQCTVSYCYRKKPFDGKISHLKCDTSTVSLDIGAIIRQNLKTKE